MYCYLYNLTYFGSSIVLYSLNFLLYHYNCAIRYVYHRLRNAFFMV